MSSIASVLLVLNCVGGVPADMLAMFSDHSYKAPDEFVYRYRLYKPAISIESSQKLPLIVWMHGFGDGGDDNIAHLQWLDRLIFRPPRSRERFPFYLLAVQCPHRQREWFQRPAKEGDLDMIKVTQQVVSQVQSEYPIDLERIYLSGVSGGGTACWEFAVRYPEMCAAVLPLGSSGSRSTQLGRLIPIPIWTFHCEYDTQIPINEVRQTVQELREAGGNIRLTEIPVTEHDCWTVAARDYHAFDWLLAQRRGRGARAGVFPLSSRVRYSLEQWDVWQVITQIVVIVLPMGCIWRLVRLRHR